MESGEWPKAKSQTILSLFSAFQAYKKPDHSRQSSQPLEDQNRVFHRKQIWEQWMECEDLVWRVRLVWFIRSSPAGRALGSPLLRCYHQQIRWLALKFPFWGALWWLGVTFLFGTTLLKISSPLAVTQQSQTPLILVGFSTKFNA
jgi:hypothetical protein